jgi:hypothetical protein
MPASHHPGHFHILQLGVFFALQKYVGGTFSAQRMHVATPPRAPEGEEPDPNAVRFNVVYYPTRGTVNGAARFSLGSLPVKPTPVRGKGSKARGRAKRQGGVNQGVLYLVPEMRGLE